MTPACVVCDDRGCPHCPAVATAPRATGVYTAAHKIQHEGASLAEALRAVAASYGRGTAAA